MPPLCAFQRWRKTCFCLAFALALAKVPADDSDGYLIDVWTVEHGLPSSSVTSLSQTPDGYLWVGTYNGLARFDGVRFVKFDPDNTPELKHARVRQLYVDTAGILWISTYDGSLTSYRDGMFLLEWMGEGLPDSAAQPIPSASSPPPALLNTGMIIRRSGEENGVGKWETIQPPGYSSGQLCVEDGDGILWTRSRDQNLWRYKEGEFQSVATDQLSGRLIRDLEKDRQGRLWIGTEQELAMWDGGGFRVMTPTNGPELDAQRMLFTRDGGHWIVGNGRVRQAIDREWIVEAWDLQAWIPENDTRYGLHQDALGGIWLYHYGKGLVSIRPDGATHQFGAEDNFPGRRVDCFFEDREGNLWAGVDRGGLVRLRQQIFRVLTPGELPAEKVAVSVAEDADGAIWVGTFGAGLNRYFAGRWEQIFMASGNQRGFIFSVMPGYDGRLWISAGEEDLHVRVGESFELVEPDVHGVKTILPARNGTLWLGTKSGLVRLNGPEQKVFQPDDGVRRIAIRALAEDNHGNVWAGAGDGTLYRVNGDQVESFLPPDSKSSQPIWSLLADEDGTIWAGTFRGGLLRFSNGRFSRIKTGQGLPDNVICQILDDQRGNLWMGSQQGIFKVAKQELHAFADGKQDSVLCTTYGRYDGLPSLECSGGYQPACWRARDGSMLFSTLRGVVKIVPEALSPNRLPPPAVVEEILVDGQPVKPQNRAPGGIKGSSSAKYLEVPPDKRQVEFRYVGLSLVSPDRVRFRYWLKGLDGDWIAAGTRGSAQYSFLRPGSYEFQVQACNNDGVWSESFASVSLEVLPKFYETRWFIFTSILAAVALIAGIVRHLSVRRMGARLEQVERQRAVELDRSRIAKDIHDDLGAGLTHIVLLSEMARPDATPDLQNQLSQITEVARELTTSMDEIVWAVNPENDSLDGLVTYVCKFAQDYLRAAGIRCRLDVPAELPARQLPAEVRHNLFLAIKESLNNVVKHARASEVWVRARLLNRSFVIVIEDNGQGITASRENGQPGRVSSGHGLPNLEKRLAANGGGFVMESKPGQGTRVELSVPLNPDSPELASSRTWPKA